MGRKLSEVEKARLAARRVEKASRAELGPLFADQAEPVDETALLYQRRKGHAGSVVKGEERLGALRLLDDLWERQLMRLVERHVGAEAFSELLTYRRRVYPPDTPNYGLDFWKNVLTGQARVVFAVSEAPGPTRFQLNLTVEERVWPPEGWKPPFTKAELEALSWRK